MLAVIPHVSGGGEGGGGTIERAILGLLTWMFIEKHFTDWGLEKDQKRVQELCYQAVSREGMFLGFRKRIKVTLCEVKKKNKTDGALD